MSTYKCHRTFVPPQVLENLARAGIEEARSSIQQSELSREKRSIKDIDMETFTAAKAVGRAARQIYDCQNKWVQRVKLVRGEGDPVTDDDAVNDAYDYTGTTRDHNKRVLNRNSIDNLGMDLIANVHFGKKYMNAFYDGDEITLGDGDGKIFVNFAKSLDVIAHEWAHGVTQFTANLKYYSQSGALNEHFSDVLGTVITQYKEKQTAEEADWLIGDEIMGPELRGEALRSVKAPGTAYDHPLIGKDPQPDHMKDYYTGAADNQGVHINSGIPNKAFYLTAKDIGTEKAGLIWYTALQGLWRTAVFNDAVDKIVEAAKLLVKNKQVRLGSTQIVRASFKAVGLPH